MQFQYIEYFVTAVQCNSLNRAARMLDISVQKIYYGIATMEKELGYPLLIRSHDGVYPTSYGKNILQEAQQCINYMNRWKKIAHEKNHKVIIRLGASATLMRVLIPSVLAQAKKIYNYTHYELRESYLEEIFKEILDCKIMGIVNCVSPRMENSYRIATAQNNLLYEEGPDDSCVVIINKNNPLANQSQLTTDQLKNLHLCFNPKRDQAIVYREIYQYFSDNIRGINIPQQENLLRLIALEPMLAAVLPKSALISQGEWSEKISGKTVADFPMPGKIWLIYPEKLTQEEAALLDILRDSCSILEKNSL